MKLFLLVALPLCASLGLCVLVGSKFGRPKLSGPTFQQQANYLSSLFRVDAKALHAQPLLWLVLSAPFFWGIAVSIPFVWAKKLDVSAAGIAYFFESVRYGIYILSVSLPMGLLVARMHSTVQVEAQIETAAAQNTFTNFYRHRDVIRKHIEEICEKYALKIATAKDIYAHLFPGNSPSAPLSTAMGKSTIKKLDDIRNKCHSIDNEILIVLLKSPLLEADAEVFVEKTKEVFEASFFLSKTLSKELEPRYWHSKDAESKIENLRHAILSLNVALIEVRGLSASQSACETGFRSCIVHHDQRMT
ncbi:hypothetical protein [Alcanivorax sp.]|uniref:hypothetical protein n=1 Tax=Alcanivorax sp. TaxID=1872427 RepID=UPI002B26DC46|nr:hypothetical protein [Alcanivorax sp.]